MWIFGYGSLLWRPDFTYEKVVSGYLKGWVRRFYQGSTDHRGIPGAPGRVVTLVEQSEGRCWGKAYRVAAKDREAVLETLDFREKNGYLKKKLPFHSQADREDLPDSVWVYWASENNPHFLGPAQTSVMATQISNASGPSGPNKDYLLNLYRSLLDMQVHEPHIEALVNSMCSQSTGEA